MATTEGVPFLVRLYPRSWRARYGDEFVELLAACPPSLRDRVDIILGAVDARIHPQLTPDPSQGRVPAFAPLRLTAVLAGTALMVWMAVMVNAMVPWESGLEPGGPPIFLAIGQLASYVGAVLAALATGWVAVRYEVAIGVRGVVGAVLLVFGLLISAIGGGVIGLALLAGGTVLFAASIGGRLVSGAVAAAFAAGILLMVVALVLFVAGGGQILMLLWLGVGFGPAWMLLGVGLREPTDAPA